jgi:hypothetical protein
LRFGRGDVLAGLRLPLSPFEVESVRGVDVRVEVVRRDAPEGEAGDAEQRAAVVSGRFGPQAKYGTVIVIVRPLTDPVAVPSAGENDLARPGVLADVRGVRLTGSLAWMTWLIVHLWYLIRNG